ncbi:MAG: hypothetical protein HY236_12100, partial [Acidobacteria bacterium]|nr:hypothetical protein [Acidobacteriota bacterium]
NAQYQTTSGGFQLGNPQSGFELFGAQTGFRNQGGVEYAVGLVNGSNRMYDDNSQKDFYASAGYKFGGYGVSGSREELTELKATDNYIDNSVSIGGFGYIGRSRSPLMGEVRFNRWGLRADISIQKLNVYGAYVHGADAMMSRRSRQKSNGYFIEGDYVILPWIIALVRYDQVLLGQPMVQMGGGSGMLMPSEVALFSASAGPTPVYHTMAGDILPNKRLVPALVFAIRANITLTLEGIFPTGQMDPSMLGNLEMQKRGRIGLKFYF